MTVNELMLKLEEARKEIGGDGRVEMCTVGRFSTVIYTISNGVTAPHENTVFFLASSFRIVPNNGDKT